MKRSKQKGSPQLKPRGAGNSVSSSPLLSPDASPSCYSLEHSSLSKSAPNFSSFMMPPQSQSTSDTHMANFRSLSPGVPQHTSGTPQTGLGILLTNKNNSISTPVPTAGYSYTMTSDQSQLFQDDLADRELQASALAAAGMATESGSFSIFVGNRVTSPPEDLGLQPPPALGSFVPPPIPHPNATMDVIDWNNMDVGMAIDDMEVDFAKMFDPAHEIANMPMEGSGWPGTVDPAAPQNGGHCT
jgi:hypothetical protein